MRYATSSTSLQLLSTLLAAGLVAACDASSATAPTRRADADAMAVETTAAAVPARLADAVATVELASGAAVTFLELGDGDVGLVERAPRRARFVAIPLVERLDATPLEVYLALAPHGGAAPDALLRDHRARVALAGAPGRAPRTLAPLPTVAADLATPSYGANDCLALGSNGAQSWIDEWKDSFAGVTTYREATYRHWLNGTFTFYPGAAVYNGTNTNTKTYLGACAIDNYDALGFDIDRRIGGVWTKVYTAVVGNEMKYTFYSGVHASYRGRVYPWDGAPSIEAFGAGAAWTPSPPIGIAH